MLRSHMRYGIPGILGTLVAQWVFTNYLSVSGWEQMLAVYF